MNETVVTGAVPRWLKTAAASLLPWLLFFLFIVPVWGSEAPLPDPSPEETLRLGERMYREAKLPSGEPMLATMSGEVKVTGTAFSCVSCHLRSGIGSIEGPTVAPPVNGAKLYNYYYKYEPILGDHSRVKKDMWEGRAPAKPVFRPAYTDESLARALRSGVSPTGRTLNSAMPRYELPDRDLKILTAYLKTLSSEISPGVDKNFKYIRFATVIAGDVPPGERKEMLATLDAVLDQHNSNARKRNRFQNDGTQLKDAYFNYPTFTLARWELKGPAETWRAQLEEYHRREPVFAFLGGISTGDWQPMHDFSEQHKIPCLLPLTDLPVVSEGDWYTLYFNKGVYQEGEATARFIARDADAVAGGTLLQVVEDSPRARALAAGFRSAWNDAGRTAPETVNLPSGAPVSPALLHSLLERKHPTLLVLWTSDGTLASLEALAAAREGVKMAFVSSTLLKKGALSLPERAREFTYLSYPYRLESDKEGYNIGANRWLQKRKIQLGEQRIAARLYSLMNVLLDPFAVVKRDFNPGGLGEGQVNMEEQFESLMHVKRNYYRDFLLDIIDMSSDKNSLAYERLSFGAGQRYLSKGCYLVQLSSGPKPELVKRSDWIIF
jgi:hypothetical protein